MCSSDLLLDSLWICMFRPEFHSEFKEPDENKEIILRTHYRRCAMFFPFNLVEGYFELLQSIAAFPNEKLEILFTLAASSLSTDKLKISEKECQQAFLGRIEIVKRALDDKCAIVDVLN